MRINGGAGSVLWRFALAAGASRDGVRTSKQGVKNRYEVARRAAKKKAGLSPCLLVVVAL